MTDIPNVPATIAADRIVDRPCFAASCVPWPMPKTRMLPQTNRLTNPPGWGQDYRLFLAWLTTAFLAGAGFAILCTAILRAIFGHVC